MRLERGIKVGERLLGEFAIRDIDGDAEKTLPSAVRVMRGTATRDDPAHRSVGVAHAIFRGIIAGGVDGLPDKACDAVVILGINRRGEFGNRGAGRGADRIDAVKPGKARVGMNDMRT